MTEIWEASSGSGICDFCAPPRPSVWVYPCMDFTIPIPERYFGTKTPMSIGAWGACETCAELVESGDRETLAMRCPIPELVGAQRRTIDLFYKKRYGERLYVGGQPSELYEETQLRKRES